MVKRTKRNDPNSEEEVEEDVSNKDLMKAIADLSNRMGDFENKITKVIDDKVSGMEKNIMEQVDFYKEGTNARCERMERKMENFEQQVIIDVNTATDENLRRIDEKVNECVAASMANATGVITDERIDQLERQVRMNELVVSGVPFVENENVLETLSSLCRVINYSGGTNAIETCFRLPANRNQRRSSSSIIIKFWGADAKNDFFKQYFTVQRLCASMLGFGAPSRIYINENLTKRNFEIFRKARELKKEGKILRFNTQRGRVVIKLLGSEQMHTIGSLDQLGSLLTQSAAATSM